MLTAGSRLGPYEIVAFLGAGGMGEVWRARDTRLGREVAVKLLRAEVAGDAERVKRFEQEARAVASLSHPNILAIHDVGRHEGQPYLVTELLEGQTLAGRIQAGDLTMAKAVELGTQIARGLAAAHERGVVHRDLKPGNVFVTKDGVVKILDFGLARLTQAEGDGRDRDSAPTETGLTRAGAILGTVGYMAPEQVRGEPADARSDIFSFGCVLYELLAREQPFRRASVGDVTAAILRDDPAPLTSNVPPSLDLIIRRCLEKRREDRFDTAHDLALALQAASQVVPPSAILTPVPPLRRRWALIGAAVAAVAVLVVAGVFVFKVIAPSREAQTVKLPKIVVLPFENLGAAEDAYFAAGMVEEITSRLANVQGLRVISRTTAVEYDRTGKTVKQIGGDLGVDYVLEGSVRWDHGTGRESRVRITPQLIRVADDTHVWADRYDRVLADVFAIQSEVAESAVTAMGVALLPHEKTVLRGISTNDLEAYDLYLRGLEVFRGGMDKQHLQGALRLYEDAVDRDPRFAQALAGVARVRLLLYWAYFDRSPEQLGRAKQAAEKAVELRPDLGEPHAALGYYYYHGLLDYPRALGEFDTALKLQPGNSDVLFGIGAVLRRQGRWSASADAFAKAVELDPRNTMCLEELMASYMFARRYADADRTCARLLALSPQWAEPYNDAAILEIVARGDLARAQAFLDEGGRVAGLQDDNSVFAETALAITIYRRDYRKALQQLEAQAHAGTPSDHFTYSPISLFQGSVHRLAGDVDLARESFEAARLELEQKVAQEPEDFRLHSSLGIAYAGLGRREDAVRQARLACELMPASKDALRTLMPANDLAKVYTMVGMTSEAIAALDDLLGRSGLFSAHDLRLNPTWDPLRSDPRFQALLTKYEVRE